MIRIWAPMAILILTPLTAWSQASSSSLSLDTNITETPAESETTTTSEPADASFPPLPERKPTPPDQQTEAGMVTDCPSCKENKNFADLKAVVSGKLRLSDLTTWRRNRGLVQIPTKGTKGNIGPCGSFHYSPDSKKGEIMDNWASPSAACAFMSTLQDWKKRCPDTQAGCRVSWGDISHKTTSKFNGHQTHTQGHCIDIRPMRNGGFDNNPLYYSASDRATTKEFISLLRKKGASTILYSDPKAGGTVPRNKAVRAGHANHIHVCFPPTKKTKDVCKSFQYDANICGAE